MNKNAKKWVIALESGKFKQGIDCLCRKNRYCCLGVACEVARENGVKLVVSVNKDGSKKFNGEAVHLPREVMEFLNIRDEFGGFTSRVTSQKGDATELVALNDELKWDFKKIAKFIRKHEDELFLKIA